MSGDTFGTFGGPLPDISTTADDRAAWLAETYPELAAELVAEWTRRLDRFCMALERASFTVDRPDALTVRITAPRAPEPAPGDA